jgi:hypothetical protein
VCGTFSELEAFESKSADEHVKQVHDRAVASGVIAELKA